jgi:hypothetical protein
LKIITAGLLSLVFVVTLPLGLLARNWADVLFNPDGISQALGENLIDTGVLHQFAVEALLDTQAGITDRQEGLGSWLQYLDQNEFQLITEMIFPPEWAKAQVDNLVKSAYAWIDDERLLPSLAIELIPLKARLLSGGSAAVMELVIDSWPSCDLDQVEEMSSTQRRSGEMVILLCEPPEPLRSQLVSSTNAIFNRQIRNAPDWLPLVDIEERNQLNPDRVFEQKESIRLLRGLAFASWLLPMALLGIIMSLMIRSYEALSKWWGWPLMAAGMITFLLLLLNPNIAQSNFQRVIDAGEIPPPILGALRTIWERFLDSVMGNLVAQSFLLVLVGGLLIGIQWWRKRRTAAS